MFCCWLVQDRCPLTMCEMTTSNEVFLTLNIRINQQEAVTEQRKWGWQKTRKYFQALKQSDPKFLYTTVFFHNRSIMKIIMKMVRALLYCSLHLFQLFF